MDRSCCNISAAADNDKTIASLQTDHSPKS